MTPWTAACQASLSFTISQTLLKLMSIESVMAYNSVILFHPFSSWLQSFITSRSFLSFPSWMTAGGQREELRPWQRSGGRRLGIRKGVIKPQETACSRASNPQTRVCFMLSPTPLTLWGALPHNHFSRRRSKCAAPRQ